MSDNNHQYNEYLLSKIELHDGRELIGVIDFVTKKQIYFFDFTFEESIDYILLTMLWKGNNNKMRFSVFCAVEYPDVRLPQAKLIPVSNIKNINTKIPEYIKPHQRKKTIR